MSPTPLVLVPGLLCDASAWQPVLGELEPAAPVQIADHGMADSLGLMADLILDVAPPRFALAGHSMGGRVALEVLARAPGRVTRLALLDTGFTGLAAGAAGERERAGRQRLLDKARREGMRAMAREWVQGMVHPRWLAGGALVETIVDMFARSTPERFEAQIRALLTRPDRGALLPRIGVPTLVLVGHQDAWSPLPQHRAMARGIARSTLVAIPECGHMSPMEQPALVAGALLAWLHDRPQIHVIPQED